MKNYLNTLLFMVCAFTAIAQTPQKFNYQAVARNAQGAILPNQNVKIRASILDGSANGMSQYTETHSVTTSQLGLFNLAIGGGILVSGDFMTISWANGDKFPKIEMDATGGNNFSLVGTSQLLSVPYALNAGNGSQWNSTYTTWWTGQHRSGVSYDGFVRIGPEINSNSGPISPYKLHVTGKDINDSDLPVVFECKLDSTEIGDQYYTQSLGRILRLNRSSFLYPNYIYDFGENEYGNFFISSAGTNNQNPPPPFVITGGEGNVGIGTKNAVSKLQVSGGDIYVENIGNGVIMKSPNGNCWRMTVDDTGQPVFTNITCPQ